MWPTVTDTQPGPAQTALDTSHESLINIERKTEHEPMKGQIYH